MNVCVPQPYPDPLPDWMAQCNLEFYSPSSSKPLDMAYCPPGGNTSEIRNSWAPPETESEVYRSYSPSGTLYQMSWSAPSLVTGDWLNGATVSFSLGT